MVGPVLLDANLKEVTAVKLEWRSCWRVREARETTKWRLASQGRSHCADAQTEPECSYAGC